jgi:integrase
MDHACSPFHRDVLVDSDNARAIGPLPSVHRAQAVIERTVGCVIESWWELNEPIWSEATRRDYAHRSRAIEEDVIGGVPITRLRVEDVERWHARMRAAGVGEGAIRGRHLVLRAALSHAERWDWVSTNVASRARLRTPRRAARGVMTDDEVRRVLKAAREIDSAAELALRIGAVAGARRAEIAGLRWDDFDGTRLRIERTVEVRRDPLHRGTPTLIDAPTKTGSRRAVMLDSETGAMIEAQRLERSRISTYMFSTTLGPPNPDRIGWWWQRVRAASRIDKRWRLHDLRHWSATAAISSGADVRTVAGRLGHSDPSMTLRVYAHALTATDAAIAGALSRALAWRPQG